MAGKETERILEIKPSLIDFIFIGKNESLSIEVSRLGPNKPRVLEVTKSKKGSDKLLSMLVDKNLLEEARGWVLKQPLANELTDEEIKKIYPVARNVLQMFVELGK